MTPTPARLIELAGADAATRGRALDDLLASTSCAREQHRYREALRERFPAVQDVKNAPRGLRVDGLLRVADDLFYIFGWAYDNDGAVASLSVLSPRGERVELFDRAFWHPHADADGFYSSTYRPRASGFVCCFKTRAAEPAEGWIVLSRNAGGDALEARAPAAESSPHAAREVILSHLRHDRDEALIERHAFPAIDRIQRDLATGAAPGECFEFGRAVASPSVSLVVPICLRIDLIEHQLAALARDPELRDAELIYVLDSPELADEFREKLRQLSELYRLPLRGVVMNLNRGVAAAGNVGASLSRARWILFLHSDVIPIASGWVGRMMKLGDGPVGATLLYHDDSIQHAGLRVDHDGRITTPNKGLHRDIAPAMGGGVEAVSAACLMVGKDRFRAAGGFSGRYAGGEHEDVDLCARLRALGHSPALLPEVALYHLEGQSRPKRLRELAEPYDRWLVARRWRELTNKSHPKGQRT